MQKRIEEFNRIVEQLASEVLEDLKKECSTYGELSEKLNVNWGTEFTYTVLSKAKSLLKEEMDAITTK